MRADQGLHRRRGVRRAVDLARREQPAEAVLQFLCVGVVVCAHFFFPQPCCESASHAFSAFTVSLRPTRAQQGCTLCTAEVPVHSQMSANRMYCRTRHSLQSTQ
ncbi:unnamed protein product [Pelagomonas calceolata]|uniref:Uncharacterized protein n=1 Tax=Pelagomonas calceolata TaxID=35677 RepID=A0A8J2SGF8_9STRA|nr:unnamed protein product [Pelagomonas calceolata]